MKKILAMMLLMASVTFSFAQNKEVHPKAKARIDQEVKEMVTVLDLSEEQATSITTYKVEQFFSNKNTAQVLEKGTEEYKRAMKDNAKVCNAKIKALIGKEKMKQWWKHRDAKKAQAAK